MSNFPKFDLGSLQSQLPWLILFLLLLDIHWFQGPCSKGTTVNSRLVGCLRLVGRCCGCWWVVLLLVGRCCGCWWVVLLVASCLCGLSLTNWSLSVYFWEHLHCANNLLIRTPPSFSSGEREWGSRPTKTTGPSRPKPRSTLPLRPPRSLIFKKDQKLCIIYTIWGRWQNLYLVGLSEIASTWQSYTRRCTQCSTRLKVLSLKRIKTLCKIYIPCSTSFGGYSAKRVFISSINNCTSLSIKSKIEPTHGMNTYIELILVLCWGSSSVSLFVAQCWEAFSTVAMHACGCFLLTWHPDLRKMWFQW